MTRPPPMNPSVNKTSTITTEKRNNNLLQKRSRSDNNSTGSSRDRLTRDVLTRQNNPNARNSFTMAAPAPVVPTVSHEQMYSNFEEWIKMATDNKINATNTWNFALIDYFHEMTFIREGDSINFQRASCTLDGCVKIYTSRVDSVVTEAGKLLTGLADHSKDGTNDGDQDGEDGAHERRSKRRAHRSDATLLKDFSSLMLKKLEVDFAVDPLFKKTSADFDEGGARGLLLNHLGLDQDCKIIFDSSDARPEQDDDTDDMNNEIDGQTEPQASSTTNNDNDDGADLPGDHNDDMDVDAAADLFENQIAMGSQLITIDDPGKQDFVEQELVEISTLKAKLRLDDLFSDLQICPTLNGVDFFKEGTISLPGLDGQDKNQGNTDGMDMVTEEEGQANAREDDQLDYGYDAFDFGDDDGGGDDGELMDPFADPTDVNDGLADANPDNEQNTDQAAETDIVTNISSNQENELLSYFDTTLSLNWAGPTHWKLRKTKSTSVQQDKMGGLQDGSTNAMDRSQKKAPVRQSTIDFLHGEDIIEDDIFAPQRRGTITLSNTKDHLTYLLPDDENFSSKQLLRYFMKPVFSMTRWKNKKFNSQTDEPTEIPGNNPHDVFDMDQGPDVEYWANQEDNNEPQDIDFGNDGMEFDDDINSQFEDVPKQEDAYNDTLDFLTHDESAVYGDALITNHQVKKTKPPYVEYARTSKRVDVRKLKENLWKALILDPMNNGRPSENGKVCGERKFTDVLLDLKKMYPPKVMKDISVPFCFICLLHLANEENLVITGLNRADDGDEFVLGDDPEWMASEDMLNEVKITQIA